MLAPLTDPVHDVPLLVAILCKALAALAAFVGPLFQMHTNVVFAVAEFCEDFTAHLAAEDLVVSAGSWIQAEVLDYEPVG